MYPWLFQTQPRFVKASFVTGTMELRNWALKESRHVAMPRAKRTGDLVVKRKHVATRRMLDLLFDPIPNVEANKLLRLIKANVGVLTRWTFPDDTCTGNEVTGRANAARTVFALVRDPVLEEYKHDSCALAFTLEVLGEQVNKKAWREQ